MHTQAGFVVKVALEVAYEFDVHRGDVFTWITDMGWIMGPLSVMGVHALRRHAAALRGCAGHAVAGARVGARRAPSRRGAGRLADADPRAQGGRRRPPTARPVARCASSAPPASRGTRTPTCGSRCGRRGQAAADQLLRRHRGRRRVPRAVSGRADQGVLARRPVAGDGRRRLRPRRQLAARRRSASSSASSRGRR